MYIFKRINMEKKKKKKNIKRFLPNLVYALILWRSGLGLLMDKFCQVLIVTCQPHYSGGALSFYVFINPIC